MACSIETKSVDFVLLYVNAKSKPPKKVRIITNGFLKNMCPNENTTALIKMNNFSFENNAL